MLSILLSACAQLPPEPPAGNDHEKDIPDSWQISGKLGINTPQQSGSVTFQWQQNKDAYRIRVQGPLGQGSAIIQGNDKGMIIERAGKPTMQANDPEALMLDTLGWALPIKSLRYWVRGLPNPQESITESQLNTNGSLSSLEQSGWLIDYSRYTLSDRWLVPGKLITQLDETRLTLIVRRWQFN